MTTAAKSDAYAQGPLTGVRVLDLSRVLAGPWASQTLGDLGADVIKIEKPGAGDDTRGWGPPFLDDGSHDAAYFTCANRNKASVAIDIATEAGAALVRRLVPHCHVLVENFKVGGLRKYGLDYDSVRALNPALVYASITGFGQTGPDADKPGYDFMIQAQGGLMSITGEADGAPTKVGVAVADLFTGLYATIGILAALRKAEATGEGQHVDVALLDVQAAVLANQATNFFVSGQPPGRMGNAHPNLAPYNVFAAADGHLVVAVGNDGQFAKLCRLLGLDALASDPDFATNAARVANRARLFPALEAKLQGQPRDHWLKALSEAGVPCGPINRVDQVFAEPQIVHRAMAQTLARPDGAAITSTACPVKLSATPATYRSAPPRLGQDTGRVLAGLLGLDKADIDRLRSERIIEGPPS